MTEAIDAEQLAARLAEAARASRTIALCGAASKRLMAGPVLPADVSLSTRALNRLLQYEPNDLTISVEAGMRWADLQATVARHGQMVALDPPFAAEATVGGVIASNTSGPMRKLYGTARDLVIGMQFATVAGKLVRVGGMVVKNVAGLDIGKLMIGSFGTLAAITSVNLRLHALPEETRTFLFGAPAPDAAMARRDAVLSSYLRPLALDLVSPAAANQLGYRDYLLAVRAGGSASVLARYGRELAGSDELRDEADARFWQAVGEFPAAFLRRTPEGVILRISTPLTHIGEVQRAWAGASIARAGTGVTYVYADGWGEAARFWEIAARHSWTRVVEFAPQDIRVAQPLWPAGSAETEAGFDMMKKVKRLFDQGHVLNRSRLYGRL